MDFRDTPEEAAFRQEVAGWLDDAMAELPDSDGTQVGKDDRAIAWQRLLHQGGWAAITWPEEYGGRGLGSEYDAIFFQEAGTRNAPMPANLLGTILAGPTIMVHGTEEQKERFLPRIPSGEEVWCQGFSEPDSGSDLASLRSRAERVEDGYVVNGQKVWNSFGHRAQRCMLLARTDTDASKHGGISYLLAPMDEVEVRPLVMLTGESDFNELFLDDVHVPAEDLLGEEGNGWRYALTTLAFERSSLAFTLQVEAHHHLAELADLIRDKGRADDPTLAVELGRLWGQVEALRLSTTRAVSALTAGKTPGAEGSTSKLTWSHTMQDMALVAMRLLGPDMELPEHAAWRRLYLRARGKSVEGGTDEIQRSIIAEKVLGLPRSR